MRHNQQKFRMINGQEGVSNGHVVMFVSFNKVTAVVRFFILDNPNDASLVSLVLGHPYFDLFKIDSFGSIAAAPSAMLLFN